LSTERNIVGEGASRRNGTGINKWFCLIVCIVGVEEDAIEILGPHEAGSNEIEDRRQLTRAVLRRMVASVCVN
jgi:hypothetical protein